VSDYLAGHYRRRNIRVEDGVRTRVHVPVIWRAGCSLLAAFLLGLLLLSYPLAAAPTLEAGVFLRADDGMPDPRFRQSVILLIRHAPDGTLGLIINRPLVTSLEQLFPRLPEALPGEQPLYYGGPVRPELISILFSGASAPGNSREVLPGVRLGSLARLLKDPAFSPDAKKVRVLTGVASWAPGQLNRELARGDWTVRPAQAHDLFAPPEHLWQRLSPDKGLLVRTALPLDGV